VSRSGRTDGPLVKRGGTGPQNLRHRLDSGRRRQPIAPAVPPVVQAVAEGFCARARGRLGRSRVRIRYETAKTTAATAASEVTA